jgi:hypothetical protein
VPPRAVAEAAQSCRNITVQSFDAPHCLLQAVPEEAAQAVALFVEKAAASRDGGRGQQRSFAARSHRRP